MKAAADEDRMAQSVDIAARLLGDADAAIFTSGKNGLIAKDLKKTLQQCRPKLGVKELFMEPDEGAYLQAVHGENRSSVGSIDPKDTYFHVIKTPAKWKDRKPAVRRFVPGNTAFKSMSGLPILQKHAMLKVPGKEREAIFRGVIGSDKWTPGLNKRLSKGGAESESEEAAAVDDESDDGATGDMDGNVILFYMELHPKAGPASFDKLFHLCVPFLPVAFVRSARSFCGKTMPACWWTSLLGVA